MQSMSESGKSQVGLLYHCVVNPVNHCNKVKDWQTHCTLDRLCERRHVTTFQENRSGVGMFFNELLAHLLQPLLQVGQHRIPHDCM